MSAPKSNASKLVKRFGKMADEYQARIDRQSQIIDRLTKAHLVAVDALEELAGDGVVNAQEALDKIKIIIAVPTEENSNAAE